MTTVRTDVESLPGAMPPIADLDARAMRGIKLLLARQAALQLLTLAAGIVIARVLTPSEFGLFFIASFLVQVFALFGVGMAAALVQRSEELTTRDLRVAFTLEQGVTTLVVIVLFATAPWLAGLYPDAPPETVWLVRALAFGLYLNSWRSMSMLQLERQLRFRPVAVIEVAETLAYQLLALALALSGLGVWSFVWATLARVIVGSVLAFGVAPWSIGLAFDRVLARRILRFGVPFQVVGITNQLGAWVVPVLVGMLSGPYGVGLLTWASSNARKPLLIVESVMRVAFPHVARLQNARDEVDRVVNRYLAILLTISGLWFVLILVAAPALVPLVYTEKWSPAVPALTLTAAALGSDVVCWVLAIALSGIGHIGSVTRVTLGRNVGFVALSIPLVAIIGYNGVPIAYLVASTIAIPICVRAYNRAGGVIAGRRLTWLAWPLGAGAAAGLLTLQLPLSDTPGAVLSMFVTLVAYAAATWIASPAGLWPGMRAAGPAPVPVAVDRG